MTKIQNENHIGIDVSKDCLDVYHLPANTFLQVENSLKGIKKLISRFKKYPIETLRIVMESTGGYEKLAAKTFAKAGFYTSIVNPRSVRDFAKAHGRLAKTDKLDAKILAIYSEKIQPKANVNTDEEQEEIGDLIARRDQLVSMIVAEKNRLYRAPKEIRKSIKAVLEALKSQLKLVEKKLKKAIAESKKLAEKHALLVSVKGIGSVTATALIAHLPELGTLGHRQISALAGLAPFNCDSGKMRGSRMIWGGRRAVRVALYMATMAAVRSNNAIKTFYQRLVKAGKAPMIALTACMRKLLIIMNAMVRDNQPWHENYAR
jgi:transposase